MAASVSRVTNSGRHANCSYLRRYDEVDRGNDNFNVRSRACGLCRGLHPVDGAGAPRRAQRMHRADRRRVRQRQGGAGALYPSSFQSRQLPFVALNCAAIPENMLEAILFGWSAAPLPVRRPPTGQVRAGTGGSLLLDEISEMPLALQAKLLRVLQEREVERLGHARP